MKDLLKKWIQILVKKMSYSNKINLLAFIKMHLSNLKKYIIINLKTNKIISTINQTFTKKLTRFNKNKFSISKEKTVKSILTAATLRMKLRMRKVRIYKKFIHLRKNPINCLNIISINNYNIRNKFLMRKNKEILIIILLNK
jgi:hypothetical protein